MAATDKDYATGSAAAYAVVQQDEGHIPVMVRSMIPQDKIKPFCDQIAKAVTDAVDKGRG